MGAAKRETLSEGLRRFLAARPESLAQIGRDCDVDHTVLSRFLRGERGLTTASLDRLCAYLGLELHKPRARKGA